MTQSGHSAPVSFSVSSLIGAKTNNAISKEQTVRELAILTFVSADGVMQAPKMQEEDPSGGFTQGGWANPCWDNVMESVGQNAMSEPYDVLLGRNTYDAFAPHFSAGDSPLNKLSKYVVTSRPIPTPWQPTIEIRQNVPSAIAKLKAEDGPLLQVHGSHGLVQLLLQHGLIDEYRIWTFPVILGSGKRLFGDGAAPANIVLQTSEALTSGAVMSIYRNA